MVRLFVAIFCFCFLVPLHAQRADEIGPSGSVLLTGGSLAQSIDLTLSKPPAPGDFFTVNVPTKQTRITLLTPPGQRITAANAATLGLDWRQYPQKLPLGSDDGGTTAEITFTQAARAGRYRIELASPALRSPLSADVRFTSRMENFTRLIRSAPGAQLSDPVKLSRTAVVQLKLMQSETAAMLDIVAPDSAVEVTLTLPNGRILSPSQPGVRDVEWQRIEVRNGKDEGKPKSNSIFPFEDMLMPLDGTHYLAGLEKAELGPYVVRATRGNPGAGELRVAFIPFEGFARAVVSREESLQRPAPGTVRIRPRPLPFEGHAGAVWNL